MGPFCMLYWGVDGNWQVIPRMLHLHIFVHACVWLLFVYIWWLGKTSFCQDSLIVHACIYCRCTFMHAYILSGSVLSNQAVPSASDTPQWLWVWAMHSAVGQASSRMESSRRRVPFLELCWYFHRELFTYVMHKEMQFVESHHANISLYLTSRVLV